MKKELEKYEVYVVIGFIVLYILINSFCLQNFGLYNIKSFIFNLLLVLVNLFFIIKNKLGRYYGLTTFPNIKQYLYFIPLLLMISVNFWTGININNTFIEIIIFIFNMLCVGFLEEIIFRGFLFKMIAKDNIKLAIVISSLTFGIGHFINLFNGSNVLETFMQVCYATAGGFLFVTIFYKSKSLWPCIITHGLINALSIFNNSSSLISIYFAPVFLFMISIVYIIYIVKKID